ncbi:MAG TPA: hypothetical protein VGV92_08310 [Gammaproteobacteria bacterium]|nr:hypothetical protein [Gammaproteobacteria bacterium]
MSLEINGKKFTACDSSSLSDAVAEVQKLPKLPISHETKSNPKEAVTLFQRETCFIVDEPAVKSIAVVNCMQSMLLVCKGKVADNQDACFAVYLDSTEQYDWSKRLLSMKAHPIEVYVVGGETGSKVSDETLENLLKYLIEFSHKANATIVFRGQRILDDFRQTDAELPEQCRQYVLDKAAMIYRQLFHKELPEEFDSMNFGIADPLNYQSTIPNLETTLQRIYNEIRFRRSFQQLRLFEDLSRQKLMPFAPHLVSASGFNALNFCGLLFATGAYEVNRRVLFDAGCQMFASNEATFKNNLRQLFCQLGYDAVRFMLIINGNQRIPMYSQFCLNLEDNSVSPVSNRFEDVCSFLYPRRAQIINVWDGVPNYVECYAEGHYQRPVIGPKFIALCDEYARLFKLPDAIILDEEQLNPILSEFNIALKSSVHRRKFCDLMHYYANHRDEFVEQPAKVPEKVPPAKAPAQAPSAPSKGIAKGFFNTTSPKKSPVPEEVVPAKAPAPSAPTKGLAKGFFNTTSPKKSTVPEKVAPVKAVPQKAAQGSELAGGFLNPVKKSK